MKQQARARRRRAMQVALLSAIAAACHGPGSEHATSATERNLMHTSNPASDIADIRAFTSSPLRNRLRVELSAPVSEVWALVGNVTRFPEYSSGLERVEAKRDPSGTLTEYVCHFKPLEGVGPGVTHREFIRWYAPDRGYASSGQEDNAFGLRNDLNLVTVEPSRQGTVLTWDEYYDAQDLEANKASYDQALADIGANLVRRFGGRIIERYVEQSQ